jgi:hypothetical protein
MTDFPVTVEMFRAQVTTDVDDSAVQLLLDAAEEAIRARYPVGGVETKDGGQSYIFLRRRAVSITTITETDFTGTQVELDPTDFRLRDDGVSVLRLSTGVNQPVGWSWGAPSWGMPVIVEYDPEDMDAELARIQIALVQLDLNHMPGLTSETIGAWSESANSGTPYAKERESILASFDASIPPGFA